jgi:hypothetical protein
MTPQRRDDLAALGGRAVVASIIFSAWHRCLPHISQLRRAIA